MSPRRHFIPTALGEVQFVFRPEQDLSRPLVILFHGATRNVVVHRGWFGHFGELCDVALAELPGHGLGPALKETSVAAFTAAFDEAIATTFPGRKILAVGESLGALVAMGLNTADSVVALDPPLLISKLWPLYVQAMISAPLDPELWFNIFGLGDTVEERSYWDIVARLKAPTLVLAGDRPLAPPRLLPMPPALLEDEDLARLAALPHVTVQIIPNAGHALLDEALEPCLDAVRARLATLT